MLTQVWVFTGEVIDNLNRKKLTEFGENYFLKKFMSDVQSRGIFRGGVPP